MLGQESDDLHSHESALAHKRARSLQELRALRDEGWFWSETTAHLLVSPCDSEVHVWYDPYNCDLLFSPKVVEMMETLLRNDQGDELD